MLWRGCRGKAAGLTKEAIITLVIIVVIIHEGPDEVGGRARGVQDAIGLRGTGPARPFLLLVLLVEIVLLICTTQFVTQLKQQPKIVPSIEYAFPRRFPGITNPEAASSVIRWSFPAASTLRRRIRNNLNSSKKSGYGHTPDHFHILARLGSDGAWPPSDGNAWEGRQDDGMPAVCWNRVSWMC